MLWLFLFSNTSLVDLNTTEAPKKKINVIVIFHILIPGKLWGWTEESRVCLVFNHSGWRNGVGEFIKKR